MTAPTKHGYELYFEPRDDYLYVLVRSETINVDTAIAYLEEIAAKCKELKYKCILLERDIPVILTGADLFFATNYFLNITKGKRVAFVNPHNTVDEDMDFAILVARNRGASHRVCRTVEAAEKWLRR